MDPFRATYPTLCDLLVGTCFDADISAAVAFGKSEDDMKGALKGRVFALNELMWLLCGAVFPEWANGEAVELERGLAVIVSVVGIAVARTTYRDKFLVEARSTFQNQEVKSADAKCKLEDVQYEIAATAKACSVLDTGSIVLEKPIADSQRAAKDWKNSDVFGTFQGQPVRIEVTVLHETLPPAIHLGLDDLVKQANVTSGFRITLRSVLVDLGYAERLKALIELLHERHLASSGEDVEIDGVQFTWEGGAYRCRQKTSPCASVCFDGADECSRAETLREIIRPCSVRVVTPSYVLEDSPNPPGVVTSADCPDASTQVPVSTKVRQMLDGKRQQCEEGVINIVALGNPLQMHDREVVSAVYGPEVCVIPFRTDERGVRHSGRASLQRSPKAPFAPANALPGAEERATFIEPFRKMSAVWHIRIGSYAISKVIPNPNALRPVPEELVQALSDPPLPSEEIAAGQAEAPTPSREAEEEAMVFAEMAENLVQACGSLAEARSVLSQLERKGTPLDELRQMVDRLWSGPSEGGANMQFVSPTNEEVAMILVVDCGGYEEANTRLEAYAEEIDGHGSG